MSWTIDDLNKMISRENEISSGISNSSNFDWSVGYVITSRADYNQLWGALKPDERFTSAEVARAGHCSLMLGGQHGIPVIPAPGFRKGLFFLQDKGRFPLRCIQWLADLPPEEREATVKKAEAKRERINAILARAPLNPDGPDALKAAIAEQQKALAALESEP